MRAILVVLFVSIVFSVWAQNENIPATESFTIEGRVKKSMTISLADLSSYDIVTTNHLKERRSSLKKVKAVLLKDILDNMEIVTENHQVLNEYYLVCIASDNYKVVFSWNEIFNSETGKSVYILTGHDGKPASALDNRMALVSSKDELLAEDL